MAVSTYNELDYTYAVARLSALETHILGMPELEKLLNASSAEEASKYLGNAGWKVSEDFEEMLNNEQAELFSLIDSLGGEEFLDTQRLKFDYHNLKVLIKAELTGKSEGDMLVNLGNIKISQLQSAVLNRNYNIMSDAMKNALMQVYDQYARLNDIQVIDIVIDSAFFKDLEAYMKRQQEKKIVDLLKMQIDMYNIKAFLRIRKMEKSHGFIEKVIAGGGSVPADFFIDKINVKNDNESSIFEHTPYSRAFMQGANLELELDNIFLENVNKARRGAFGLAPIAAYFWIKENEMRNVRIILTCKRAGINIEAVRSMLRG